MALNPSPDELLPATVERLPYPIGFCWVQATQPDATVLRAIAAAEFTARTMCALVLADVIDVAWSDELQAALGASSLERQALGTRLKVLGLLIDTHERTLDRPGRVLPPLRTWWNDCRDPLEKLVNRRNVPVHKGGVVSDPAREDFTAELAGVLRGARWLQQVQLALVRTANRTPEGTETEMLRLRGSAPHRQRQSERVRWSADVISRSVYMGKADGTLWRLVPGIRPVGGTLLDGAIVEVFDGVEKGTAQFVNPEASAPSATEAKTSSYRLHLPGYAESLLWPDFVAQRQSATWTLLEPRPHPGLVLRDLPLDLAAAPGKEVHGYRLVKSLGEGPRSYVWEAYDKARHDRYALKFLRGEAAESSTEGNRLEREIHWLKLLHARGCRRVVGPVERVGSPDSRDGLLLRMPLYRSNLAARVKVLRDELSPEAMETQVIRWAVQALEALEDVSREGVVHREIDEENFLVDEHDDLVLADFGSANAPADGTSTAVPVLTRVGDRTGFRLGPESLGNPSAATPADDVHALASTFLGVLGSSFRGASSGAPRVRALKGLLREMEARDPSQRPNAATALARMRSLLSSGVLAPFPSSLPSAPLSGSSPAPPSLPHGAPSVAAQSTSAFAPVPSAPSAVPLAGSAPPPPSAPAAPPRPAPDAAFAVPASAGVVFGPAPAPHPLPPGHALPVPSAASPSAVDARPPPPVAPLTHPPQPARSGAHPAAPRASLGKWVAAGAALVGLAAGAMWASGAGGNRSVSPREPGPASTARPATTAPAPPLAPPSCPDGMVGLAGATVTLSAPEGATDPSRAVAVAPLCIDRTEVTVAAYAACVGRGQCTKAAAGDGCNAGDQARLDHPANCVVWRQADAYCRAQGKRLPTSDEWEYAARGLEGREFPWGSEPPEGRVCDGQKGSCTVASNPSGASPSGALDMAGNVHEWTSTRASPNDGLYEYRGGSWTEEGRKRLGAALRAKAGPDFQRNDIGFRCARSASP
jgi:formylglycine-generating enzyme required for sulfatase activity/serine/threonine protein kinase